MLPPPLPLAKWRQPQTDRLTSPAPTVYYLALSRLDGLSKREMLSRVALAFMDFYHHRATWRHSLPILQSELCS